LIGGCPAHSGIEKLWRIKLPSFESSQVENFQGLEILGEKLPNLGNSGTKASKDWKWLPQEVLAPAFSGPSFLSPGNSTTQQLENEQPLPTTDH